MPPAFPRGEIFGPTWVLRESRRAPLRPWPPYFQWFTDSQLLRFWSQIRPRFNAQSAHGHSSVGPVTWLDRKPWQPYSYYARTEFLKEELMKTLPIAGLLAFGFALSVFAIDDEAKSIPQD